MKASQSFKICTAIVALALLCSGCSTKPAAPPAASSAVQSAVSSLPPQAEPDVSASEEQNSPSEPIAPPPATMPEIPVGPGSGEPLFPPREEPPAAEEASFTFADLAGRYFYFSSGAGAWHTEFTVEADGSFSGFFQDSDMGDLSEEYPNGTLYFSAFSGHFSPPEKVDELTYTFSIEALEYANDFGEEIKDGLRYVYTDAYGLRDAETLYLYLPGSIIRELPEAYRSWVGYHYVEALEEKLLPFYGLYNESAGTGFSSHGTVSPAEVAARILEETEAVAGEYEAQLQNDPSLSQTDMNILAQKIYVAWDDAINSIWDLLKETLPEEEMEPLVQAQRQWISEKEAAAENAAAENEGGSLAPLLRAMEAAAWTKERCYSLKEYFK